MNVWHAVSYLCLESREPGGTDRVTKKTAALSWCPCLLKVAHPFEVKIISSHRQK